MATLQPGEVTLTWDLPMTGGADTLGYKVQRQQVGTAGPASILRNGGGTSRTFTDRAVTRGSEYTYTVEGCLLAGNACSFLFDAADITVTIPDPPVISASVDTLVAIAGISITSVTITLDSGDAAINYSIAPPITNGLAFDENTGMISGMPTAAAGAQEYTITATSATGEVGTTTVTITVEEDTSPTLPAQASQSYTERTPIVALVLPEGSGGNAPLTYALAGESAGLSFNEGTRTLSGTPTTVETSTLTYTVTDRNGDTAELVFMITIEANMRPVSNPGDPQTVAEGAMVTLDGSGSSDPDGDDDDLTYGWFQVEPATGTGKGSDIALSSITDAAPTFTAPSDLVTDATLVFELLVVDALGLASFEATVTVIVTGVNDAPTADAGTAQTVAQGAMVTLNGLGSRDPEGETLTFAWMQTSGTDVTLSSVAAAAPTFTAPSGLMDDATLEFSLTVTDASSGVSVNVATVTITVSAANQAPIADPGDAQTVDESEPVMLDGGGSLDPERETLTFAWTQTAPTTGKGMGVALTGADTAMPTFTAPSQLVDNVELVFSLVVTDMSSEASVNAATVTITVEAGPNDAPTAVAITGTPTVDEGALVTLNGSDSSDPEGETLKFAWTQTAPTTGKGMGVALTGADTAMPTFTAPSDLVTEATLEFSLIVTETRSDAPLSSTAATVTVTVTAGPNDAPLAVATTTTPTVDEGETGTLNGIGSSDPENEILRFTWMQTEPSTGPGANIVLIPVVGGGEDSANTGAQTFTAPTELAVAVDLEFSLIVTDARNEASTADTVTITVTAGTNDAPTAVAITGTPTVADAEEGTPIMVMLDGSGSSDPEGEALTYAWTHTNADITLNNANTATPTFTAPSQLVDTATLEFSLVVTETRSDAPLSSTAATVTITVEAGDNDAPTAVAGDAQTVADAEEGTPIMVTLDGSGSSDPEGETFTFAWTHTNAGITLNGADTTDPTFTAPKQLVDAATLEFSLIVTDARDLASTAATVTITVTAGPNDAPTAVAGNAQTVADAEEGTPIMVTLDGSGTDPEGETLTYAWMQTMPTTGQGSGIALTGADTAAPTFTAPTQLMADVGLVFSLIVSDGRSLASTADTVTITVTAGPNDAPTAVAVPATRTVAEGATVTMDGSGSSDPESETLTYAWTQTGGTSIILTNALDIASAFIAPRNLLTDAELEFSLVVTETRSDAPLSSTAATVTITVTAGDNDAPTVNAGPAQAVAEGETVTLMGSGTDPEGETVRFAWTQTEPTTGKGMGVALTGADTAAPTFTAPTELVGDATLIFSLIVTDASSVASTAATVTITVTAGDNDAPTVNAGPAQAVAEGETVTLMGSGTDPEGEALTFAWTQTAPTTGKGMGVALTGADTAAPTFTAPTELVGDATLIFSLIVTDASSVASTAATVTITVTAGDNDAPTVNAGPAQAVAEGETVTLDGSGTDPEGEALTFAWTQTEPTTGKGSDITLTGADTAAPTFTAPTELVNNVNLVFSLIVTDARDLASTAATVKVTVTTGTNDKPSANAGTNQIVNEGVTVTLDGSGTDPEGETVRFVWTQSIPSSGPGSGITLSSTATAAPTFTAPSQLADDTRLIFNLTVIDVRDEISDTDTVTITVTAGTNDAPTANAGPDQDNVAEGVTVTLDGSGTDPEGEDLTFAWTQTSGTIVTLSDATAEAPTFTAPSELTGGKTLIFSLIVSDARGLASTADTVTITVTDSNEGFAELNTVILPEIARAIASETVSAITQRIDQARSGDSARSINIAGQSTLTDAASAHGQAIADGKLSLKDMLGNSDFVLPLADDGMSTGNRMLSSLTLWGGGGYRNFEGSGGSVDFDGDLFSAHLGVDARPRDDLVTGLAVSWSQSDLGYSGDSDLNGDYKLDLTSVNPYVSWEVLPGQLDLWATAGYGWGDLEINDDVRGEALSDIEAWDVAVGGNIHLLQRGPTMFRLKSSALLTGMEVEGSDGSEGSEGSDGSDRIEALEVESSLLRMVVEGAYKHTLADGAYVEPSLEAGVRYDGGDGETGLGAELGAGFRYIDPKGGLTLEGKVRTLIGRDNYEEWGISGLILLEQGRNGRGLSFSLSPGYGSTGSNTQEIWQEGLRNETSQDYGMRLDTRLGYGMMAPGGQGLLTPYSEMTFGSSSKSYRLGMRWELDSLFDLNLTGERKESDSDVTDHAIMLKGDIRF